jgi:phosphotransacetylase
LVKSGIAHGGVTGSCHTTAAVIRAGLRGIGTEEGTVSSCFLMVRGEEILAYGDCGVIPTPTADQLVSIAVKTAGTFQKLTQEVPRVAFLSFSSKGSADHRCLDPIREALRLIQKRCPELCVDGELQFDAAYLPEISARKAPQSPLKGRGNVFIFPDLNAGNIAYKITERLAGFTAIGPLLQGFKAPWMDLSRGCSSRDILLVGVITALLERHH